MAAAAGRRRSPRRARRSPRRPSASSCPPPGGANSPPRGCGSRRRWCRARPGPANWRSSTSAPGRAAASRRTSSAGWGRSSRPKVASPERGDFAAGEFEVTWIDARGTLLPSTMGSGPSTPQPGFRLLGAVVEGEGGPWFFKVTGPESTLAAASARRSSACCAASAGPSPRAAGGTGGSVPERAPSGKL